MGFTISEESYIQNSVLRERRILTSSSAFGILRQELARNIGIERIKAFLLHFGWEMGVNDAKEAMKKGMTLDELIKYGPILHIENGHIRGIKHDCTVKYDEDGNVISVVGTGVWIDSYEAEEHVKRIGLAKEPVCYTLIGYASGYMSIVCGQPLHAKELTCVGRGDSECSWVVKTQKQWESEGYENLSSYDEKPIVEELEFTYEQLLEQQEFVTKLATFQKKLTEEISNGSDLQTIADMVYNTVQLPVIVEDIDLQTVTYAGLSKEKYMELKADMEENISADTLQRRDKQQLPFRKKVARTTMQERLVTPITVQKEVMGYCAFIYDDMKNHNHKEDYLFLDRFANAVSLILLNEKTKFESFERMKGNFLDQILDGQLPVSEIIKRGKYTRLDLSQPYYVVVMDYKKKEMSIEEEFSLQEHLFETTFRYFNDKKHDLLVGHREGKIILLIMRDNIKKPSTHDLIKEFNGYLIEKYPKGEFKFGISNESHKIENALKYYEEAVIASRLSTKKSIVPFHSLGIVGVLINSKNISGIKVIAEQELGSIYNTKDPKAVELLKTLYVFLLNGGKLEQTMNDLSLSLSGLRHRIKRIESLLEKDLRDPNEMHQLLLVIKSLIALGDLTFE